MNELQLHRGICWGLIGCAVVAFVLLQFLSAPYGRHVRDGWGPRLPTKLGWILMEAPAVFLWLYVYARGEHRADAAPLILLGLWQLHYVNRTFVYPLRARSTQSNMPVTMAALAFVFQCANAYVNARQVSHFGDYGADWLRSPQLLIGGAVFAAGFVINNHADHVLRNLRKPGETGYKIPRGGLYERVTCPNYLGELLEWTGWAVATWSLAGVSFLVFTAANLVPRALTNHAWYREKFDDYPPQRKALIPFVL